MSGEHGAINDTISLPMAMLLAGLFAISQWNSLEIYISIFRTFRRRRGLYFCSALIANTGILLTSLFCLLRFFDVAPPGLMSIFVDVGWCSMVTGQSLMLYSRLHLVMCDPRKLRWVLCITMSILLVIEIPVATLFVTNTYEVNNVAVATAFDMIEKTQLVVIGIVESVLSGLYLYEWARVRKELEITKGRKAHVVFHELIGLFLVVIALDISLIVLQFSNLFQVQVTYKPLVYSIKLKAEIYVLNNLAKLVICRDSFQNGQLFRNNAMPLTSTVTTDDGAWRSRHTHSLSAAGGVDSRHGSETGTKAGSLSTMPTGQSCTLKLPRDGLSI
ncbi:hypothetical protein F5Y09DRAFT_356601 [Xylaria sp. FL1042]|nr:hypothetical protein F5Y09DRAFT_356601 [Xylaria sp. FL1042]